MSSIKLYYNWAIIKFKYYGLYYIIFKIVKYFEH